MSSVSRITYLVIACCVFGAVGRCATARNPLPIRAVLDVQVLSEGSPVAFSPDGRWLAYTVRRSFRMGPPADVAAAWICAGIPWEAAGSQVHIVDVRDNSDRTLPAAGNSWLPAWSPDGRYLAFLSDGGLAQVHLAIWDLKRQSLKEFSRIKIRASQIQWDTNSDKVLTTVLANADEDRQQCHSPNSFRANASSPVPAVTVYESGVSPTPASVGRHPDPWNLDDSIRDLAEFGIQTGSVKVLTHGQRVEHFGYSPDSSQVAFTSAESFETPGSQQIRFALRIVSIASGEERTLAQSLRLYLSGTPFTWLPHGSQLVFQEGGPLARAGNWYIVPAGGGASRRLSDFPAQVGYSKNDQAIFDASGKRLYFLRDEALWCADVDRSSARKVVAIPGREIRYILSPRGDRSRTPGPGSLIVLTTDHTTKEEGFYSIRLPGGDTTALLEKPQSYWSDSGGTFVAESSARDQVVFSLEDEEHPPDLWVADGGFQELHRLTHLNPQLDQYPMGASKLIHWSGLDGESLSGAVLLPPDYRSDIRYPLIVWVYGGVSQSDLLHHFGLLGLGEPYNLQLFATRGYVVLAADSVSNGAPLLDFTKSVLPGIDTLIAMGVVDSDRVGIMGHSYGGYTAFSLITQTPRFKAAVMSAGFGDLISAYGQLSEDGSAYQTGILENSAIIGGSPWKFRDKYVENSPLLYADRVSTPLLIIHGGADSAVAPFLAAEVFVALRQLGKKVTYARYNGEDHTPYIWTGSDQMEVGNRVIHWFNRYLRPESVPMSASGVDSNPSLPEKPERP